MPFSESHKMGVSMGAEVVKGKKPAKAKGRKTTKKVKVFRPDKGTISIPEADVDHYVSKGEWKVVD